MKQIKLGRTNLIVGGTGFGAIPIQRISFDDAKHILRKAYENGVNLFDTARAYSDSEEKIGCALSEVRKDIIIASKSMAKDKKQLFKDLETSLKNLKTDYIDIYQLHSPFKLPDPDDTDGLYGGLLEAKEKGMICYIGISNHRVDVAIEAAKTEMYDTVQFPLSSISAEMDLALIEVCRERNLGVIAMKALAGGLITNVATSFAFLRKFGNVVPIYGIQRISELDEFLTLEKNPPVLDDEIWKVIKKDRKELAGNFCRGCGYCMPCPEGIIISHAARLDMLLRRAVPERFLTDDWRKNMELINNCTECGQCSEKCPYELDTPNLLRYMLKDYQEFYKQHVGSW